MSEWFETLPGVYGAVWDCLTQGVRDVAHPARRPTFATVSSDGWPEARTVVLRGAGAGDLEVYTDLYSDKIKSLQAVPRAALHVWDEGRDLQVRLQTEVTILTGDAVQGRWNGVPDHGRQSYGVTPAPGVPIAEALDYVKDPDPATFAVLRCRVIAIDAVYLGARHRRAAYLRSDDWAGQWLVP